MIRLNYPLHHGHPKEPSTVSNGEERETQCNLTWSEIIELLNETHIEWTWVQCRE